MLAHGLAYLPEDREGQGLVSTMSVRKNVVATILNKLARQKALDDQIASDPKYQRIQFVDTLYANDDPDKSYAVASSAMQAYPDLKLFISGSGISNPAINKAIMDTKRSGKIFSIK